MSNTATSTNDRMVRVSKKLEIKNKLGLHARAAALFVQTVNKFASQITVANDGRTADGRSIMGMLTLGATQGSKIQIEATGADAEKAVRAIEKLIDNRFNENE
ncbi:MAG: HPr family phosphocarrier protein [Deltaproteobacteria bacterium]|nr:HPr family phosphocarrier protein [Deltaproteobacteria bacterium]